ncbi:MAG: hypothetical protein QOI78_4707 [Actinomycetota bacterium]|nr:hypothetical protein [Actinomycetota bacterium]
MTGFRDFTFKLIVVEQLMYTERKLTPAFRIADVLGVTEPWDHTYRRGLAHQVVYDVPSLDDLALLPNLRHVVGSEFLGPELRDVLRARGIAAG